MKPSRNEHSIAVSCEVSGRGYWSGREVHVRIHPAPAGTGVRLIRSDLPNCPECPAVVGHARDCQFRTNLECGDARFAMIEHLMAALAALEVDNCRVEIDGEELPGLDGSSAPYVEALRHAGLIVQARARKQLVIAQPLRVELGGSWITAAPSCDGKAHFEYRLSYDDQTPIRPQSYRCSLTPQRFMREVAPARTFVTEVQADQLRSQGVARHVTNQDLLVFGSDGPIGNELRFSDECARHKTLDMIGDLALVGVDFVGEFVSYRGGHRLNAMLARALAERMGESVWRQDSQGEQRSAA